VPNRFESIEDYRYGFNGMEKDDEIKGEGNSYDFGARMLDPRVGRWFSPDAYEKKYPSFSPYSFALNSPMTILDPDGNDIIILGDKKYRQQVLQTIRDLYNSSPSGRRIVMDLINSKKVFLIVENKNRENQYAGFGSSKAEGYIIFNYNDNAVFSPSNGLGYSSLKAPPITTLAHELKHAHDDLTGATKGIIGLNIVNLDNPLRGNPNFGLDSSEPEYFTNSILATEVGTVEFENQVRAELGLTLRTHYGGINIFEKKISSKIYKFGAGSKSFSSPKLEFKEFDTKKYNVEAAVSSFLKDVVESNNWWDLKVEEKLETNLNYGFGNDSNIETNSKTDKALRLSAKKKK
jgi:RHS repeat-associated protein